MQEAEKDFNLWEKLKQRFRIFRNKYILTLTIFGIYALFLDDNDMFTLISQNQKLSKIKADQAEMTIKLRDTRRTLRQLKHGAALERYAREEKMFKKDDEDVFLISYE